MKRTIIIFLAAVTCFVLLTPAVYRIRNTYFHETISRIGELPPSLAKILTLDFQGVAADLLFLKTISFMGLKIGEHGELTHSEWQRINDMLYLITELDPMFWDPYLFGEMMLTWQAGMVEDANKLLLKATNERPQDYRPWYYLGFNAYYFQGKSDVAAYYFRKAAQYSEAPLYIKGLASRFSLYGNQTALGINFLSDLLQHTNDPKIIRYLSKRLEALKRIFFLEQKVSAFKKKYGRRPSSLNELIEVGLLEEIPEDPYGGQFVILENGRIYSTSKLIEKSASSGRK